jgi:hypothetical protein
VNQDGVQGLWHGLTASLILCSNPAITYGVFRNLKKSSHSNILEIFLMGVVSKALATIVTCISR